jgi:N-acetylneuraminate lyase
MQSSILENDFRKRKLTGLIAAPFTPMFEDGSLNLEVIPRQANALAANDVAGAFICGTTGEGMSLTVSERIQVAERWMAAAPERLPIIVHVGHTALDESKALARHAQQCGAQAIASIGPAFFRPASLDPLVEFCARIAEAAPALPFYYYHLPALTGVDLPMLDFLKAAGPRIPNLAGIKFTHENLMDFSRCLSFEEPFDLLFGRDEILLAALALGATGAVGSTYSFMAPVYQKLRAAFQRGDLADARRHQTAATEIIAVMIRHGGLPAGKAMMKMIGIDCGPVRSPLRNLSPEQLEDLRRELERAGFPALNHEKS